MMLLTALSCVSCDNVFACRAFCAMYCTCQVVHQCASIVGLLKLLHSLLVSSCSLVDTAMLTVTAQQQAVQIMIQCPFVAHRRIMGWTLCAPPMASSSHCSDTSRNSIWAHGGTLDRTSSTGWGPGCTCLGQSHQSCPGRYVPRSVQKVSSFLARCTTASRLLIGHASSLSSNS